MKRLFKTLLAIVIVIAVIIISAFAIVSDMIKDNTVEVDAVSGATMSSEVIKDAVRDALRSGL